MGKIKPCSECNSEFRRWCLFLVSFELFKQCSDDVTMDLSELLLKFCLGGAAHVHSPDKKNTNFFLGLHGADLQSVLSSLADF